MEVIPENFSETVNEAEKTIDKTIRKQNGQMSRVVQVDKLLNQTIELSE
jgi:hypothetical protein